MRTIPAVLLLTTALLAGACGGDDDGGGGGTGGGSTESPSEVLGDADEGIEGVQSVRVDGNTHVEGDIDYGLQPPAGGKHNPVWWNCGFYDEPVVDESAVHDLEHGAVWIAYAPDLPAEQVETIHELARQNPKVLAAPYEGLPDDEPVVVTAWARQLRLESADDPRLAEFVDRYIDGDQSPEAGVACTGTPLGNPIP